MPINSSVATAMAAIAAAEVSMASLLMAAGAADLVVVVDDDGFPFGRSIPICHVGDRGEARRLFHACGTYVSMFLYVYGHGDSRRVHGLYLTQANLPFIHAFAHPYQLRLKKGRVPLRDGSRSPIATWFEDSEMQVRRNFRIGFVVVATRHSPASPLALPCIAGISVDGQDSGRSCHRIGALAGRLPHAPAPRRCEWRSHGDGQGNPVKGSTTFTRPLAPFLHVARDFRP